MALNELGRGQGFAGQRRSNGTGSRQVDLKNVSRVRITTKWWSLKDRLGKRCMLPAEMLQHPEVVDCLISGVRTSQLTGSVDLDSTMALLLSSTNRGSNDEASEANEIQGILAAGPSRGFWPVINRALNVWIALIIAILVFTLVLFLVIKL